MSKDILTVQRLRAQEANMTFVGRHTEAWSNLASRYYRGGAQALEDYRGYLSLVIASDYRETPLFDIVRNHLPFNPDVDLTPRGVEQAEVKRDYYSGLFKGVDDGDIYIITSGYVRSIRTGSIISEAFPKSHLLIIPQFAERLPGITDFGWLRDYRSTQVVEPVIRDYYTRTHQRPEERFQRPVKKFSQSDETAMRRVLRLPGNHDTEFYGQSYDEKSAQVANVLQQPHLQTVLHNPRFIKIIIGHEPTNIAILQHMRGLTNTQAKQEALHPHAVPQWNGVSTLLVQHPDTALWHVQSFHNLQESDLYVSNYRLPSTRRTNQRT